MIKSQELKCFYEIKWKIKSLNVVFSQLKLEISKLWNGTPYLTRKRAGVEKVSTMFEDIYKTIRKIIKNLYSLTYLYNRIYRNIVTELQSAGVFINNQWSEDPLSLRVEESNTVDEYSNIVLNNVSNALNLTEESANKNIDDANIIDLLNCNKARIHIAETIAEECKKFFNTIINSSLKAKEKGTDEIALTIKGVVDHTNSEFDTLKKQISSLSVIYDEMIENILNTLKNAYIEIETKTTRIEDINEYIGYYDLADLYRSMHGMLRCDKSFNKLLENKQNNESNNVNREKISIEK